MYKLIIILNFAFSSVCYSQSKQECLDSLEQNKLILWNNYALIAKYTGDLDTLVKSLTEFHFFAEVPEINDKDSTFYWPLTIRPFWYYTRYRPFMTVHRIENYYVIEIKVWWDGVKGEISPYGISEYQKLIDGLKQ